MANPEHLAILKKGVEKWMEWRSKIGAPRPDLSHSDFTGEDLAGAFLSDTNLQGANLSNANLTSAYLTDANLYSANLSHANLSRAYLTGAVLHGAVLDGAYLFGAKLDKADLSDARLHSANLPGADFAGADLSNAELDGANLSGADFAGADLSNADLDGANLHGAKLNGANLTGTRLFGTNLTGANLVDANLAGATIHWAALGNVHLDKVKGLETVNQQGPSTIGADTLYLSNGKIPVEFLRQAGVPQSLISYLPSLLAAADGAIQFYSCFISHSTADHKFCAELHRRMTGNGLRVWFAPEDLKGGKKLHEQLEQAIRHYDKLLLVLSESSMTSEWVSREVRLALRREKQEGRRILFPIGLVPFEKIAEWEGIFDKAIPGKDLTDEVREYYIPDFTNWQVKETFEREFEKLVAALRESEEGSPA